MILDSIRSAVDFATHLPRYREILHILFKYGFADVLKLVTLQRVLRIEDAVLPVHENDEILSQPLAVRLRLALEELGPTFVKFGQIVSSRRDLVNDEYYEELAKLQSDVPPFPARQARKIIREELEESLDDIFAVFNDEPIGAASIAQVHKAVLKDGTTVAIKVQRPDITKKIQQDTAILIDLAKWLEKHVPEISGLNPVAVVTEFSETLMRELDFTNELMNAERFRNQFEDDPDIKTPRVFRKFSSDKVLTMEFMSGIRVDDPAALKRAEIDSSELAERITKLIYRQIFDFGFFHGDPHPGNIAIQRDGAVGLYDYGMMGTFTPDFRVSVANLVSGLAEKNHRQVMRSILEMSEEGYVTDPEKMLSDVEDFSDQHLNHPLKDIKLGEVLNKLLELLRNHHLRMKRAFYLGVKALTQVEAIGRQLDPDLNFILMGEPYATEVITGKYKPGRMFKLVQRLFTESVDFLEQFPHDFRTFYLRIKRGDFNVPLQHKIDPEGFEPLRKTLDSIANRLANAILAASVLICSSIIVLAHVPPMFNGVSVIGLIGLGLGGYLCLRLILSIWRHGGL